MNPKDAVQAAANILNTARVYEQPRLVRIHNAITPLGPTVEMPDKAPQVMQNLAVKAGTNYLPLVLDVFAQGMRVDGYRSADDPENDAPPWETWQANRLRSRQVGVHRAALAYGASYVIVTPGQMTGITGDVTSRAKIQGSSPRRCTAVYEDPVNDDYPMLALYVDGPMLRLYDEEAVYFIGVESVPPRSGLVDWYIQQIPYSFRFIEARVHGLGVCPVIRFRDRMLLDGEEVFGIVEPLLSIQQRIDETVFGLLTAQYFAAFKQRYVIGWIPKSEEEKLKASASQLWTFADDSVKIGEFTETDLTRYLNAKDAAKLDMAAIAQVPISRLGLGTTHNLAAEAIAAMDAGKDQKTDEITDSFGESWKQVLQLAAAAEGDMTCANDVTAQVHWQDSTARSLAQTVDALGKLAQMLDVPKQALWGRVPGVTQTDVEEWENMVKEGDAMGNLTTLLAQQAQAMPTNGAVPAAAMPPGMNANTPHVDTPAPT